MTEKQKETCRQILKDHYAPMSEEDMEKFVAAAESPDDLSIGLLGSCSMKIEKL
jgi:hypothetical protein